MSSKNLLEGLGRKNLNSIEEKMKRTKEVKNLEDIGLNVKRSFTLSPKTVKMLLEIKAVHPDSLNITLSEIVDEAIQRLYNSKYIR